MAEGDIGSVIDTLVFFSGTIQLSNIIHVAGDIYAIVYSGTDADGFIVTMSISDAGYIGASVIDTFEFDTAACLYPNIIHVSGDVFAIAYSGADSDGFVTTLSISDAGAIGDPVLDSFEFDIANIMDPNIIHVSGDVFAIAYSSAASHGIVRTISISAAGEIGGSVLDSFEFNAVVAFNPRILHVGGIYYAIAYGGNPHPGMITTITISVAGDIGASVIDTGPYDSSLSRNNIFLRVSANVFAVVYRGADYDGFLSTVNISASGIVGDSPIETWEYDTLEGRNPNIIHVSGTVYCIAHDGSGSKKHLITFNISDAGDIDTTIIDDFIFPVAGSSFIDLLYCSGSVYAFSFRGASNYGSLKTISVETVLPTAVRHELIMGIG